MIPLRSPEGRAAIASLARRRALVGLDFDGTLAPIVASPADARMTEPTRARLVRVAERYPTVVISGRARADLLPRLAGVPLAAVLGAHGQDPAPPGWRAEDAEALVRSWADGIARAIAGVPGVWVEDKRRALSVHYRGAPDLALARAAAERAILAAPGARAVAGHCVVDLVPAGAPHKGDALAAEIARAGAEPAIFVGDDTTDEDAFAVAGVIGVRVGESADSRAAFALARRDDVDELLDDLAAARAEPA